ncbi:MAG: hypothetical protein ACQEQ4_09600 [Fibrobacterota bacterium]
MAIRFLAGKKIVSLWDYLFVFRHQKKVSFSDALGGSRRVFYILSGNNPEHALEDIRQLRRIQNTLIVDCVCESELNLEKYERVFNNIYSYDIEEAFFTTDFREMLQKLSHTAYDMVVCRDGRDSRKLRLMLCSVAAPARVGFGPGPGFPYINMHIRESRLSFQDIAPAAESFAK